MQTIYGSRIINYNISSNSIRFFMIKSGLQSVLFILPLKLHQQVSIPAMIPPVISELSESPMIRYSDLSLEPIEANTLSKYSFAGF